MRVFIRALIVFCSLVFLGAVGWLGYLLMQDNVANEEMEALRMMVHTQAPTDTVNVAATAVEISATKSVSQDVPSMPTPVPEPPDVLPAYQDLYAMNPDFAGWIKIDGTVIDYPVVYTPEDPDKYLYMLFNGKESSAGVPLIGEGASLFPQSDTITIYSHNRRNGTMFAMLTEYDNPAFYEDHKLVQFDTRYERGTYEVFAACRFQYDKYDPEKYFQYYSFPTLATEAEYTEYVDTILSAARYDTGIVPTFGEKLLVLSTCGYFAENGRIVVVARRIG